MIDITKLCRKANALISIFDIAYPQDKKWLREPLEDSIVVDVCANNYNDEHFMYDETWNNPKGISFMEIMKHVSECEECLKARY